MRRGRSRVAATGNTLLGFPLQWWQEPARYALHCKLGIEGTVTPRASSNERGTRRPGRTRADKERTRQRATPNRGDKGQERTRHSHPSTKRTLNAHNRSKTANTARVFEEAASTSAVPTANHPTETPKVQIHGKETSFEKCDTGFTPQSHAPPFLSRLQKNAARAKSRRTSREREGGITQARNNQKHGRTHSPMRRFCRTPPICRSKAAVISSRRLESRSRWRRRASSGMLCDKDCQVVVTREAEFCKPSCACYPERVAAERLRVVLVEDGKTQLCRHIDMQ